MRQYHDLLRKIMNFGHDSPDRTGTGTRSLFGEQMSFDLRRGFPLLTTKFVPFRLVASELLWFLSGSTNEKDLSSQGNFIWKEWAEEDGDLGKIYGFQWVKWGYLGEQFPTSGINQIQALIDGLRKRPFSRRHIVSAWNVADLPDESISPQENVRLGKMALAPCHCLIQFHVRRAYGDCHLSCRLDQR